jgi:hypothetical protein
MNKLAYFCFIRIFYKDSCAPQQRRKNAKSGKDFFTLIDVQIPKLIKQLLLKIIFFIIHIHKTIR